jgi:hypothetical protein
MPFFKWIPLIPLGIENRWVIIDVTYSCKKTKQDGPLHKPKSFVVVVVKVLMFLSNTIFLLNGDLKGQLTGSHLQVIMQLSDSCQAAVRQSSGSHQAVVRQSSGSWRSVGRQSAGSQQAVGRQSAGSLQAVFRQSSGSCKEFIRHCETLSPKLCAA